MFNLLCDSMFIYNDQGKVWDINLDLHDLITVQSLRNSYARFIGISWRYWCSLRVDTAPVDEEVFQNCQFLPVQFKQMIFFFEIMHMCKTGVDPYINIMRYSMFPPTSFVIKEKIMNESSYCGIIELQCCWHCDWSLIQLLPFTELAHSVTYVNHAIVIDGIIYVPRWHLFSTSRRRHTQKLS